MLKNQEIILKDILIAIDKIETIRNKINFQTFLKEYHFHDSIMYNFIVIGEASNRISTEFKNVNQEIEWHKLNGMRNHLAHSYDDISYQTIWKQSQMIYLNLKCKLKN